MPNYTQELWQMERTIARMEKALERAERARDRADRKRAEAINAHQQASTEVGATQELLDGLVKARAAMAELNRPDDRADEDED